MSTNRGPNESQGSSGRVGKRCTAALALMLWGLRSKGSPVVLFRRHGPGNHVRRHHHDAAVLTCKVTDLLLRQCSRTSVVCSPPPRQTIGALLSFLDRAHTTVDRLHAPVSCTLAICLLPESAHLAASIVTPRVVVAHNVQYLVQVGAPAVWAEQRRDRYLFCGPVSQGVGWDVGEVHGARSVVAAKSGATSLRRRVATVYPQTPALDSC